MKQKISKSVLRQYPSLSELPDINITGLSDGQVLKQDNASSTQKPLTVSGGGNAFGTIVVSGQSDVVADAANDTLTLVAGSNITLTTNATSDTVTIAASASGNAFGTIAVSGQNNVVADSVNDTLNLVAGTNITLTTNETSDTITITGPTVPTIPNNFGTIAVSGQSNVVADANSDTLTLVAGTNVTLTTDAGSDSITINASGGGGNAFGTIAVSGQSDVVADAVNDTLTLVAGTNITMTTNAGGDSITINASGGGSATITDDSSTNATYYPVVASTSSGSLSTAYVSSPKLNYNPSTGNFSATQFTSLSDKKLKKDIAPITNALGIINQLNGVEFNQKESQQLF